MEVTPFRTLQADGASLTISTKSWRERDLTIASVLGASSAAAFPVSSLLASIKTRHAAPERSF